jgi:hypothetical protein
MFSVLIDIIGILTYLIPLVTTHPLHTPPHNSTLPHLRRYPFGY